MPAQGPQTAETRASARARTAAAAAIAAAVLAATLTLALPQEALAANAVQMVIADILTLNPDEAIAVFALGFAELIIGILAPLAAGAFKLGTGWIQIGGLNTLVLGFQAIALVAVIAIRIGVGVKDGILSGGGPKEKSLGEYVMKSIATIVLVAATPAICSAVMALGNNLYADGVLLAKAGSGGGDPVAAAVDWFAGIKGADYGNIKNNDLLDHFRNFIGVTDELPAADVMGTAVGVAIMLVAVIVLCFLVGYQIAKRYVEMIVLSTIGPLVAIFTATENESDRYRTLLVQLFGLSVISLLQYSFVLVALSAGKIWATTAVSSLVLGEADFSKDVAYLVACFAIFGATLSMPRIVNEYASSASGPGMMAGMLIGMGTRGAASAPGKVARGNIGAAKGAYRGAKSIRNWAKRH